MLNDVLKNLRKKFNFTQELIAEKLGVTRQTIAKWENGETIIDIYSLQKLARLYDVSINDLLKADYDDSQDLIPSDKWVFGYTTIDEKGRVSLPQECLDKLKLHPGSELIIFGDKHKGIALANPNEYEQFAEIIMDLKRKKHE